MTGTERTALTPVEGTPAVDSGTSPRPAAPRSQNVIYRHIRDKLPPHEPGGPSISTAQYKGLGTGLYSARVQTTQPSVPFLFSVILALPDFSQ